MNQQVQQSFLHVASDVWQQFPNLRIGYVAAFQIDNRSASETLARLGHQAERKIREQFDSVEPLGSVDLISYWREVYRSLGIKPNKYMPTVEALVRRVIKGGSLPIINKAVNAYLIAELETFMPMGGYDLDCLQGSIVLKRATGGQPFIGSGGVVEQTIPNELIYADDQSVLTRHWNYRDALYTQIRPDTKNLVLFCEAPHLLVSNDQIQRVLFRTRELLQTYCGGQYVMSILDQSTCSL